MYTRASEAAERAGATEHRQRLLAGLAGDVVEVGAGHGLNFPHYPTSVTQVWAVEPEPYLRRLAEQAAGAAPVPISVADGHADDLPFADGSVDAGVASLVLCSVPAQERTLRELHRVIRPNGELRFYEHVAASGGRLATLQRLADPIWTRVAGGCHLHRDTAAAIAGAGFTIEACDRFRFHATVIDRLPAPHILGVARRDP